MLANSKPADFKVIVSAKYGAGRRSAFVSALVGAAGLHQSTDVRVIGSSVFVRPEVEPMPVGDFNGTKLEMLIHGAGQIWRCKNTHWEVSPIRQLYALSDEPGAARVRRQGRLKKKEALLTKVVNGVVYQVDT